MSGNLSSCLGHNGALGVNHCMTQRQKIADFLGRDDLCPPRIP